MPEDSELGENRPRRTADGVDDFSAKLSAARSSSKSLGGLLDEFRGFLEKLADMGLRDDVRAKVGASDLVQQTLLEATQGFSDFRGESREQFTAWIKRILVRNLLNEIRKWRSTKMRTVNREITLDQPDAPKLMGEDRTPSSLFEAREREALLREALKRLTPDQQQVIRLRHFEQLGFQDIARRMERQYSAVRMLWYRAIEKLAYEMGGWRESTG